MHPTRARRGKLQIATDTWDPTANDLKMYISRLGHCLDTPFHLGIGRTTQMSAPSLLTPYGYSSSSCGYCTPSGSRSAKSSSKKYGMVVQQMTCQFYQELIDRGWRRSGTYVYQPDMARTCCPQYTIRLNAEAFKPSKKHRQVVNRFNRYLSEDLRPGETAQSATFPGRADVGGSKGKGKARGGEWDFMSELKKHEEGYGTTSVHRYQTEIAPAKATEESFQLYKKYQVSVHKDDPDDVSMSGFRRFLCESPLGESIIPRSKAASTDKLPKKYGSYHLLYRIDGKLVGISVIDILPLCVSSVYFIWDPDYAWASLGKLSALREIALAKDIRAAGAKDMGYVYMGYWIPGCGKMVYKSEYTPSYLLEPDTRRFHSLDTKLDTFLKTHNTGYHPFASIEDGSLRVSPTEATRDCISTGEVDEDTDMDTEEIDDFPTDHTPGWADLSTITDDQIESVRVLLKGRGVLKRASLISVGDLSFGNQAAAYGQIKELVAVVGLDLLSTGDISRQDMETKAVLFFG